jgi:hypothetical protein
MSLARAWATPDVGHVHWQALDPLFIDPFDLHALTLVGSNVGL